MENKLLDQLNKKFSGAQDKVFLVGGAVRDLLLDKEPNDVDLLTTLDKDTLLGMGAKFIDPKTAYPVFSIHDEVLGKIELAHPRTEIKTGPRHVDFKVDAGEHVPVELDLMRRDFTVNSMALDLQGRLIDPFDGVEDLRNRVLRHTSPAFSEDELRAYRGCRFACDGFNMTPETEELIKSMDTVNVPSERIFQELMKAMAKKHPERFFELLVKLEVGKHLFHRVFEMRGVTAGPEKFHPEADTLEHAFIVLKGVAKNTTNPVTRLAAFLHDLGKTATPAHMLPHHYGHEDVGVGMVDSLLRNLRADTLTRKVVTTVTRQHMRVPRLPVMKTHKQLATTLDLMNNMAFDSVFEVVAVDTDLDQATAARRVAEKARKVLRMNVSALGLDPQLSFSGKTGQQIAKTVHDRQVSMLRKLLKED